VPDLTASNFWFSNRESVPLHGMREREINLSLSYGWKRRQKCFVNIGLTSMFFAIDMH
jgi:hypothetical protein